MTSYEGQLLSQIKMPKKKLSAELVHRQYTIVLKARSRNRFIQVFFEGFLYSMIDAFNSRYSNPVLEITEVLPLEKEL